jgi:hypothetical protein
MNERIKQLAEQAGWGKGETRDDCMQCSTFDPEEFAELIVKECTEICNRGILQNQDTLSKFNEHEFYEKLIIRGAIIQAEMLGNAIKQNFGVEE